MPLRQIVRDADGPREESEVYDDWLVVTQDCDLAWQAVKGSAEFLVELRPIVYNEPPADLSIRGHRLLLGKDGAYVDNRAPRLMVTPDVVACSQHLTCPVPSSARRLKTWLGLRYDRPAFPQKYVKLADALSVEIAKKRNKESTTILRDILVSFESEDGQDFFELVAVLPVQDDQERIASRKLDVENWLAQVSQTISEELGVAQSLSVSTADELSLDFLENSFALDVTSVTWPRSRVGPEGA